jgi:hypothetical protein
VRSRCASRRRLAGLGCALLVAWAAPARAIEWADGRFELHGYYELQVRGIARDFQKNDDWDLTQLAHVLNLELEANLLPEGVTLLDEATLFTRVEVRYDCVWSHGCGLFPSANAFGNGAKKLPRRLNDGRRDGFVGGVFTGDRRHFRGEPLETFRLAYRDRPDDSRAPYGIDRTEAFYTVFTSPGPDQVLGTADDPSPFFFARYFGGGRCKFSSRYTRGFIDGQGILNLGPLDPDCEVEPIAAFADKPNPFRAGDLNPLYGVPGGLALPYRPAPERDFDSPAGDDVARGLWIPNASLARRIREDDFDDPELSFSQTDLAWNHGASQDEGELKELYLDLELLEARLWLRLGKQTIVWGKTELYRSQDQFNPQDLALASLPGLEESRVALWSARAAWSFYRVGPLEDLRLELAVNLDQYEPNDLGVCGEPYTVVLVCAGTFGFLAHGFEGAGIAGVERPPDAWESSQGVEVGVRVEWRFDRFAFSVTDLYGYSDLPYVEKIFTFERNVDPRSGRPRRLNDRRPCVRGDEPACLQPGRDALENHSVNQTMFAKNCAATFGFVSLDPSACGPSLFNSRVETDPENALAPRLMVALSNVVSGQCDEAFGQLAAGCGILAGIGGFTSATVRELDRFRWVARSPASGTPTPLVALSADPADGGIDDPTPDFAPGDFSVGLFLPTGLSPFLTPEQEALLGCGILYRTRCDVDGIDLLNAEASALAQSWPGFDGTFGDWDLTDRGVAQPGTVGFDGGPVCTRFEGGELRVLPGCRGPGDRGYRRDQDGSTRALHPFTGQRWRSEMAVVSWNLLMALTAFSRPADPRHPEIDEFDPERPFRRGACSLAQPQYCGTVSDFWKPFRAKRNDIRAGGNGRFGRRDFQWHDGTPLAVRYEKRNVLGFSLDFAEDLTKSNWSIEATWIEGLPYLDNDEFDGLTKADSYNLVISIDRPTFVNFLNANRTLFVNTQWFVQYVDGYRSGFTSDGPWNLLATLTVSTGYFQDRLLPAVTVVYDVPSSSGAVLPQVTYRFTSNFSATFGLAGFWGGFESRRAALNPVASLNRTGRDAYRDFVENGLSVIRDRDELYLLVRYSF